MNVELFYIFSIINSAATHTLTQVSFCMSFSMKLLENSFVEKAFKEMPMFPLTDSKHYQ